MSVEKTAAALRANDESLAALDLACENIDAAGATKISEALTANTVLRALNFYDNEGIGAAGATKISEALAVNTVLTELRFWGEYVWARCMGAGLRGRAGVGG